MKKCPYCAEEIQTDAIKCKHCGEWLVNNKKNVKAREYLEEVNMKCPDCGTMNKRSAFRCKNENCLSIIPYKSAR